jgi:KaiC/GvpD/RAD55 family RecA-like ATPase
MTPKRKLIHELKNTFHRWEQESDLSDEAIIDAGKKALREYYDEEIIVFDSDIEFLEDDEE